ncbi:hypothetical protein HQ545_02960 [Candidatus Woesearchaeota archaeon]|nr:hypothetical protein [Candidatus Woesearchaeota archaeon]
MGISKKEMMRRSNIILDGVINGTIDIPDNALVFLDPEVMQKIITPKRMELMSLIEKKKPGSVNQLAELSGRMKQAVARDLKILENQEIIEMKRTGRNVKPILKRKIVMFSLSGSLPRSKARVICH